MVDVRLSWLQPNARWRSLRPESRHARDEFILVVHGRYRIRRHGQVETGGPGSAFFIPAQQEHHGLLDYDGSLQFVALQGPRTAEGLVSRTEDRLGRLFAIATWMRTYDIDPDPTGQVVLNHLFQVYADEYRRLGRERSKADGTDLISRARAYMEVGLATNFGIGDICAALDVGGSTLHRAFVAVTGRPPMAHLQEIRAEAVLHLLRGSRLSLAEIAGRVGMQHATSVSRLLKQVYGRGAKELR